LKIGLEGLRFLLGPAVNQPVIRIPTPRKVWVRPRHPEVERVVDVAMPVALAPTGLCGMQHADGEILATRAAEAFGVPFCLSTMSICSIEDVAANATKPFWFQLYVMRNRGFVERLIGRAKQAQCSALVVTLDLPMTGQRHKVSRNGISVPPRLTIANLIDMAMKPKWCLEMLRTRRRSFGNLVGHVDGVSDMTSLLAWIDQQFDPRLSWDDIARIRRLWDKKLVLKGIMDAEDARRAVGAGADAIVVSNHGGRQLDSALIASTLIPKMTDGADIGGATSSARVPRRSRPFQ
jgi:L-lactate dehydrogenase (cytochrome)